MLPKDFFLNGFWFLDNSTKVIIDKLFGGIKREGPEVLTALTESCGGSVQAHSRCSKRTVVLRRQPAFCRCSRRPGKSIYCLASASSGVIICLFYRSHSRFVLRRGDKFLLFITTVGAQQNNRKSPFFNTNSTVFWLRAHKHTQTHARSVEVSRLPGMSEAIYSRHRHGSAKHHSNSFCEIVHFINTQGTFCQ